LGSFPGVHVIRAFRIEREYIPDEWPNPFICMA
jgi:hypothetical protein